MKARVNRHARRSLLLNTLSDVGVHSARLGIWVESLLGYGHTLRAVNFGLAFPDFDTLYLSGSMPRGSFATKRLGAARVVSLSELRLDGPTGRIRTAKGELPGITLASRVEQAWRALREHEPDVMVFEHFPFGRWGFADETFELIARLKTDFTECQIVASVRDIPQGDDRPAQYGRVVASILNRAFDLVIVHGEKSIMDVTALVPELGSCKVPIEYTGYLGEGASFRWHPEGPLLINLGGGWEDCRLCQAAIELAAEDGRYSRRGVLVLTGRFSGLTEGDFAARGLRVRVLKDVSLDDHRFPAVSACITRMGYNAAVNLLACRVPAIAVPHAFSSEQRARALILADRGRLVVSSAEGLAQGQIQLCEALKVAEDLARGWQPLSLTSARLRRLLFQHLGSVSN